MTPAEIALAAFAFWNGLRVVAYLPQIVAVARDTSGARAVSVVTWILFTASHLSTVAYALLVLGDGRMSAVFAANALCCLVIVGLTVWKRALRRAAERLIAEVRGSRPLDQPAQVQDQILQGPAPVTPIRMPYRVLSGGREAAVRARQP